MKYRYLCALSAFLAISLASAQNYFTVVIFSDPHISQTGYDETTVSQMQSYVKNICEMGHSGGLRVVFPAAPDYIPTADLVMCLGDMDADSRDDHNDFETSMEGFAQAGIPFITLAGNHDFVPDYWTGESGEEALTGGNGGISDNEVTKTTVNKFKASASNLGVKDMYLFNDGSGHRQPDCFTFTFRGVRFYCGQTYWFQKGYSVEKYFGYVVGRGELYAPDALINSLESFVREHASEPSIWTQHYPFLAGSDCDRWWLDQNDVGRYIKTADESEFGTHADLGKWTNDATARDYAAKKKDRLANIINLTKNPIHFSGHTHQWAYNEYKGVRDYTVASTGNSETLGAAYVVLCQEGVGAIQVLRVHFDTALPHVGAEQVFLQQVYSGQYLCAANSWGTQASLGDAPTPLMMEQLSDGTYSLETGISNGGDNHFLGWDNLYCDQPAVGWRFEEVADGSGAYLLTTNGTSYLYGNAKNKALTKNSSTSAKTNARAHWLRLSRQDLLNRFAEATPVNPVDATFLLGCPDFGRNDARFGVWEGGAVQGGNDANMCAERWNLNFDVYQLVTQVPNGVYRLSCQGFYRAGGQGTTATDQHAILYARSALASNSSNEVSVPLMNILSGGKRSSVSGYSKKAGSVYVPNSMTDASTAFTAGAYADNELLVEVTDGTLRLGIRKETLMADDWTIFDRFRLAYLGSKEVYVGIKEAEDVSHDSDISNNRSYDGIFDLSGRRISAPRQGIYIEGGKKKLLVR